MAAYESLSHLPRPNIYFAMRVLFAVSLRMSHAAGVPRIARSLLVWPTQMFAYDLHKAKPIHLTLN